MYRTQQRMEKANQEMEENKLNSEFINRVTQLPVVNFAWDYASNTYGKIKDHNKLFNYTLSTAEKSVMFAAQQARPVVLKFEKQLHAVDELALEGLNRLEKTAPIITKSPDEIIGETKKLYSSTLQSGVEKYEGLKTYGTERVKAAKDFGIGKAVTLLNTPYGLQLVKSVDGAITLTESCVDYYLPAIEDEKENSTPLKDEAVANKVGRLSNKMRRRLYKHAMINLHNLQKRSQESIGKLNHTIDLIKYAKDNLDVAATLGTVQNRATWLWNELNKNEDQSANSEKNWEQQILSVARQVTKQMVKTYTNTTSVVQLLPTNVQQRLSTARDYSVDLYNQFAKTTRLDDLTSVMLKQVQQNLRFIEETFGSYFETILRAQPLTWLVSGKDNTSNVTTSEVTQEK
ncbi:lipid storage droplets surface-binding protein 2-like [Centruroides vittatus]|uniref:lipid storage droplets surface-binding protein 2-like n=1 Tax=Centruroides vittatus TaxID=120091 RepID=UPI0035106031